MMHIASFNLASNLVICVDLYHTGLQYLATEQHNAKTVVRKVWALALHDIPDSFERRRFLLLTFAAIFIFIDQVCQEYQFIGIKIN